MASPRVFLEAFALEELKIGPVGGFLYRSEALSMCLGRRRAGEVENWRCRWVPASFGGSDYVPQWGQGGRD